MKRNGVKTALWIVATVFWSLAALLSAAPAMMSFMLFDAPGSTSSPLTVALFFSALALPLFCLLGAGVPWIFHAKSRGAWLFLIPLIDIGPMVTILVLMDRLCSGSLTCK